MAAALEQRERHSYDGLASVAGPPNFMLHAGAGTVPTGEQLGRMAVRIPSPEREDPSLGVRFRDIDAGESQVLHAGPIPSGSGEPGWSIADEGISNPFVPASAESGSARIDRGSDMEPAIARSLSVKELLENPPQPSAASKAAGSPVRSYAPPPGPRPAHASRLASTARGTLDADPSSPSFGMLIQATSNSDADGSSALSSGEASRDRHTGSLLGSKPGMTTLDVGGWITERQNGAGPIKHPEEGVHDTVLHERVGTAPTAEVGSVLGFRRGAVMPRLDAAPIPSVSGLQGWERSLLHLQSTVGELDAVGADALSTPDAGAMPFVAPAALPTQPDLPRDDSPGNYSAPFSSPSGVQPGSRARGASAGSSLSPPPGSLRRLGAESDWAVIKSGSKPSVGASGLGTVPQRFRLLSFLPVDGAGGRSLGAGRVAQDLGTPPGLPRDARVSKALDRLNAAVGHADEGDANAGEVGSVPPESMHAVVPVSVLGAALAFRVMREAFGVVDAERAKLRESATATKAETGAASPPAALQVAMELAGDDATAAAAEAAARNALAAQDASRIASAVMVPPSPYAAAASSAILSRSDSLAPAAPPQPSQARSPSGVVPGRTGPNGAASADEDVLRAPAAPPLPLPPSSAASARRGGETTPAADAAALERVAVRVVRQLLHPYEAYPESLSTTLRLLPPIPRPVLLDADLEDVVAQVRDAAAGFIAAEATARGSLLDAVVWCHRFPASLSRAFQEFSRLDAERALQQDEPLSGRVGKSASAEPLESASSLSSSTALQQVSAWAWGPSSESSSAARRGFLSLVAHSPPGQAEDEQTDRLVRHAMSLLQSRASQLEAVAQEAGEMERTGLLRQLAEARQQAERLGAAWRRWREHALIESAMGCGLQTCRVLLAAERVPVLTVRQDLDLCRRHLLVSLAEASAVEVDVVGRTGGRLGAGAQDTALRGRIIQDMPMPDARKYASQAQQLLTDVALPREADAAVGAAPLRQSFTQLGGALRGTCEAASKASAERATRERESVLAHIRVVVPALQERRAVAEGLAEKRTRLAAELERMRSAVQSIRMAEERKVIALAELVAKTEKLMHVRGEAAVNLLARELDDSAGARAERLQEQVRAAEAEAKAEAAKQGAAAVMVAERAAHTAASQAEAEARESIESLRTGQWMGLHKSPTERRLEAVTASTTERRAEAEGLRVALAKAERGVAAAMRRARHEQRMADARRDTKRMFSLRRSPPAVMARFFAEALQGSVYSPRLVGGLRRAHERLLTKAEERSAEQRAATQARKDLAQALDHAGAAPAPGEASGATESAVRFVLDAAAKRPVGNRAAVARAGAASKPLSNPNESVSILNRLQSMLKSTAPSPAGSATSPSMHGHRALSASQPVDLPSTRSIRGLDGQVRERARQWLRQDDSPLAAGLGDHAQAGPGAPDSKPGASNPRAAVPASRLSREAAAAKRATPPRARISYDSPTAMDSRRFSVGVASAKTARELLEAAASSPGSEPDDRVEAALVELMRRRDSPQQAEADDAIASIVQRLKQSLGASATL